MTRPRPVLDWAFLLVLALSIGAALHVLARDGSDAVRGIFVDDLALLATILPKVAAGCVIGAFVRLLVPRETIVRWLGAESGLRGLMVAAAAGAIFPGGPFTIFPLAAALMLSGADRGAAVAFVTGWLLLGLNRAVIWEIPFLGADFVALRLMLSLPLPVAAGLMARGLDRLVPSAPDQTRP